MTPEEQFRALQDDQRWESTKLAPRPSPGATAAGPGPRPGPRETVAPVLITAVVAVLVIVVSIGVIRLGGDRTDRLPAATATPVATPTVRGATATIRGTAPTTTRTIAGAGMPGGPDAAEIVKLQALARRVGKMVGQPDTSVSSYDRLSSAIESVHAAFGSALHTSGGAGRRNTVVFIVLDRTPTAQELQLLRLLPFTVRLSWGRRISVKERDRQQQAAFLAVNDVLDATGDTDDETDTQTLNFWPDRDHPRSAAQIAQQMAATITRLSGKPPTFSIEVTDLSKTAAGQAALHAKDHPLSATGVRLLIGSRPTDSVAGVGAGGRFAVDAHRCVTLGDAVVIAPPGSAISADGRTFEAKGVGTYSIDPSESFSMESPNGELGGTFVDAKTAATYLPRGSTLCGATQFLLLAK